MARYGHKVRRTDARSVAASSVSLDVREKLEDDQVDWWVLEEDEYRRLPAQADGTLRSRVFPGLWLDLRALLAGDGPKLMAKLQQGLQTTEHTAFIAQMQKRQKP